MDLNTSRLWLLTGERGAGKTGFCRLLVEHARASGWKVAGLLSPAVFAGESKIGIQVEDLGSGQVRQLASVKAQPPFTQVLGKWHLDPVVLAWSDDVLKMIKPCDLLVIDEIGPLELLQGQGWTAALPLLSRRGYRAGLVVIRPELVEKARLLLPDLQATITLAPGMDLQAEAPAWWERLSHD